MCVPGSNAIASRIAKAVADNSGLDGVDLNNLKDKRRTMALPTTMAAPTVQPIKQMGGVVLDVSRVYV